MIIRALHFSVIVLFMLSCASPPDRSFKSNPDSSISGITSGSTSGRTASDFKTFRTALSFAGVWVNKGYVDSIRKNRSPIKDQAVDESCINIPDSTLKTTSMIYGFHEGGAEMVIVKDGSRYQFYDPELKTNKDIIEPMSSHRIRIGNHYFQKIEHADMEKYEWGILNEILFGGKYQNQDGKEVIFEMNGHIQGLDTISYYQPHADYTEEQDLGVDRISMGRSKESVHIYGYQFDKDTLFIYRIECLEYDSIAHQCGSEKPGDLKWKLRRMPG